MPRCRSEPSLSTIPAQKPETEGCERINQIRVCLDPVAPCHSTPITSSGQAAAAVRELRICEQPQEEVWVLCLDARGMLRAYAMITRGSVNISLVSPSDIFRVLITNNTMSFILIHNHPSGDPSPSDDDRALTARIADAARIMGFRFLDHIIIGTTDHWSFRDGGLL